MTLPVHPNQISLSGILAEVEFAGPIPSRGIGLSDLYRGKSRTINNFNAFGSAAGDSFGEAVAISGNYAIIGVRLEDDEVGGNSGKAYIINVDTGALVHTLNNPNAFVGGNSSADFFGWSVGISGNYAIVGGYFEDDANGNNAGKVYIFNVTTGALVHTLNNPNPTGTSELDRFAESLAIDGDYAIVGAYDEDTGASASGVAYIFNVTTGALVHTLNNPNAYGTSSGDVFGWSVDISGNYAIVGAVWEDDENGSSAGKAYIFNVTTGELVRTLNNPNPEGTSANDNFGDAVAISGNYAVVSSSAEFGNSGYVYIFDVVTGASVYTIPNPNIYSTGSGDRFGWSVGISGNNVIVGTPNEDGLAGSSVGVAYIFSRLVPTNAIGYPFGSSVIIPSSGQIRFGNFHGYDYP